MDAAELIALKNTYGLQPTPPQGDKDSKSKPLPKPPSTPPNPDPAGFYAALFQNLVKHQPLTENALTVLAQERASAVVSELATAGGINTTRLKTVETNGEGQVEKETVAIRLNLTAK